MIERRLANAAREMQRGRVQDVVINDDLGAYDELRGIVLTSGVRWARRIRKAHMSKSDKVVILGVTGSVRLQGWWHV